MDWISFSLGMAAGGFFMWIIVMIRVRTATKKLMKVFEKVGKGERSNATV